MDERRYLRWMLGSVLLLLAAVTAFNLLVDPYLVTGRPRVPGFNAIKPAVATHEHLMKAYQAYQAGQTNARTVVLGSSRSGTGIDPDSPHWPDAMRPVYNLSVAGTRLPDQLHYLELLLAAETSRGQTLPGTLVVGLDFESFLYRPGLVDARPPPSKQQAELHARLDMLHVLASPGPAPLPVLVHKLAELGLATATLDALEDSVATVLANRSSGGPDVLANGRASDWQLRAWTLADGASALFEQKHRMTVRQNLTPRLVLSDQPGGPVRRLQELQPLFALARAHNIRLVLLVQASHVTHHELLDALGYWADLERWKQTLTQSVAAARATGIDVRLWDFAGYENVYQDPVTGRGQAAAKMRWFWDPVHYNTDLGDRMIAGIFANPPKVDGLGEELTPATVTQRLAQVQRLRAAYRLAHPQAQADAQVLVCGNGCDKLARATLQP